ncbi:MAG: Rieske 2Fe-2S domain-containing protein [Pleurocapsa sp.]
MDDKFNFFQQWYPISPIEDLDPNKPTAVTLLGLSLVIWKPRNATNYRIFLNQCPHRLAPLSEGRIDEKTDNLMCSYHGWEFDTQGKCTRIPQAENPELAGKNICAIAFPTRQENNLLWVWADSNSTEKAENTPLPLSPLIDASKGFVWSSFVRDLEYDWQTLVENVCDPSHVAFAHHGVQGNRERAKPIPLTIDRSTSSIIQATTDAPFKTTITFQPPCRLEYNISFGNDGKKIGLVTYCMPVAPNKSRIVAQFPRNFAKTLHRIIPRWWEHINTRNLVLDGDMILLRQQEYFLQQRSDSWQTAYKLPTSADRLVIEFRKWLDRNCDARLPWNAKQLNNSELNPLACSREILLDRYHQHTQHCSSCRNTLETIKTVQWILLIYFVLAVSGVAVMSDSLRISLGLPLVILAILGLGVYSWLKFWLQPKFYFVDYIHSER